MIDQYISQNYHMFCEAEGNQHIASEYAIKKISNLIESFNITNVLEIGLGIGSIAGTILKVHNDSIVKYCGTEDNEFCLRALEKNLGSEYRNLEVYPGISNISTKNNFDLVIIDGVDGNLEGIKSLIANNAIIAIEGDRAFQISSLNELFPKSIFVHCISKEFNSIHSPFSKEHWQGGVKLIFVNPTIKQKVWCLKERVNTKLKYSFRAMKR